MPLPAAVRRVARVVGALVVVLAAVGCSGDGSSKESEPTTTASMPPGPDGVDAATCDGAPCSLAARCPPTCGSAPRPSWIDDGDTWLDDVLEPGTAPLPFDADLAPKPMYDAVHAALAEGRPS